MIPKDRNVAPLTVEKQQVARPAVAGHRKWGVGQIPGRRAILEIGVPLDDQLIRAQIQVESSAIPGPVKPETLDGQDRIGAKNEIGMHRHQQLAAALRVDRYDVIPARRQITSRDSDLMLAGAQLNCDRVFDPGYRRYVRW